MGLPILTRHHLYINISVEIAADKNQKKKSHTLKRGMRLEMLECCLEMAKFAGTKILLLNRGVGLTYVVQYLKGSNHI